MEMMEEQPDFDGEVAQLGLDLGSLVDMLPDPDQVDISLVLDSSTDMDIADTTTCWGALLSGSFESCQSGFVPSKGHFKNHFCSCCRTLGIRVPADRVRAIGKDQHTSFENVGGRGLWSKSEALDVRYRLVNQTQRCAGPRLIILQSRAPKGFLWGQLPSRWLSNSGSTLRLLISKGTLTPAEASTAHLNLAAASELLPALNGSASTDDLDDGGGSSHKRSRTLASVSSDELASSMSGVPSSAPSMVSTETLVLVHEQLARLVVHSLDRSVEDQEALGVDDEQRSAFLPLLATLKVSMSLLRRPEEQRASAADDLKASEAATVALSPRDWAASDAIATLHSKCFGALDMVHAEHVLRCASRGLGDGDMMALAHVLREGGAGGEGGETNDGVRALRQLDLSNNYLTSACSPLLSALLAEAYRLEMVDLSGSRWGDEGVRRLTSALSQTGIPALRSLCLRRCFVAADGAAAIARLLAETKAPVLEELALEDNQIPDSGLSSLAGVLLLPMMPVCLRLISLGNCLGGNAIGDAGVIALAEAFAASRLVGLEKLGLSYNLVTDGGAEALLSCIQKAECCPRLSFLSVAANEISKEMVRSLSELARARQFCLLAYPQLVR